MQSMATECAPNNLEASLANVYCSLHYTFYIGSCPINLQQKRGASSEAPLSYLYCAAMASTCFFICSTTSLGPVMTACAPKPQTHAKNWGLTTTSARTVK